MISKLVELLAKKSTNKILMVVHIVFAFLAAFAGRNTRSGDHETYLNLGLGLLQGKYSFWYFLDPYPPDTFRTPGYPIFLLLTSLGGHFILLSLLTQAILYIGTVYLSLQLIRKIMGDSPLAYSIWLLLAFFNAQFFYYVHLIFPEALMMFLLTLYLTIEVGEPSVTWQKNLKIGILLGVTALVRPVAMLIPLGRIVLLYLVPAERRRQMMGGIVLCCVATYTVLLPYALWNQSNHGKFSFVPVEGSAPNREMGFWQLRLPNEFTSRYWHDNWMGKEIIPFVSPNEVANYRREYDAQWDQIDKDAEPFLTEDDKKRLPQMDQNRKLFYTFSTKYTLKRAELIEDAYRKRVAEAPGYYLSTRFYTAIRQWVTAPDFRKMQRSGVVSKIAALYPFLVTFICFVIGLPLALWRITSQRFLKASMLPFWALGFIYCGSHVLMTIQSRYMVPLQPAALALIACALAYQLKSFSKQGLSVMKEEHQVSAGHLPALDGVRGAAILLVLFYHLVPAIPATDRLVRVLRSACGVGWTGVDLFFVLSGFLITGILLNTKGKPNYYRNFFARRALRLLPLYYGALLFFVYLLPTIGIFSNIQAELHGNTIWLWIYCTNFLVPSLGWFTMSVFWSLSVEEHFYLIWPALVSLLRPRMLAVCGLIIILLSPWLRMWTAQRYGIAAGYTFTYCRLDGLALGALLALGMRQVKWRSWLVRGAPGMLFLGGVGFLALAARYGAQHSVPMQQQLGYSLLAITFGALLVVVLQGGRLGRIASLPIFTFFGKYSYGIYVIHYPLRNLCALLFDPKKIEVMSGSALVGALAYLLLSVGLNSVIAWMIYHAYEKRFLALKSKFAA